MFAGVVCEAALFFPPAKSDQTDPADESGPNQIRLGLTNTRINQSIRTQDLPNV